MKHFASLVLVIFACGVWRTGCTTTTSDCTLGSSDDFLKFANEEGISTTQCTRSLTLTRDIDDDVPPLLVNLSSATTTTFTVMCLQNVTSWPKCSLPVKLCLRVVLSRGVTLNILNCTFPGTIQIGAIGELETAGGDVALNNINIAKSDRRGVWIANVSAVTIRNMVGTGCVGGDDVSGGCLSIVNVTGNVSLFNVNFSSSRALGHGGCIGIAGVGGAVLIESLFLSRCTTTLSHGGGLAVFYTRTIQLTNVVCSYGSAISGGCLAFEYCANVTLTNITAKSSEGKEYDGGCVDVVRAQYFVGRNIVLESCTARTRGGGLSVQHARDLLLDTYSCKYCSGGRGSCFGTTTHGTNRTNQSVVVRNVVCDNATARNSAGVLVQHTASLEIRNLTFFRARGRSTPTVDIDVAGNVSLSDVVVSDAVADKGFVMIFKDIYGTLKLQNVILRNFSSSELTVGYNSVILLMEVSIANWTDVMIQGCGAGRSGSCVSFQAGRRSTISLQNVSIANCQTPTCVEFIGVNVTLDSVTMESLTTSQCVNGINTSLVVTRSQASSCVYTPWQVGNTPFQIPYYAEQQQSNFFNDSSFPHKMETDTKGLAPGNIGKGSGSRITSSLRGSSAAATASVLFSNQGGGVFYGQVDTTLRILRCQSLQAGVSDDVNDDDGDDDFGVEEYGIVLGLGPAGDTLLVYAMTGVLSFAITFGGLHQQWKNGLSSTTRWFFTVFSNSIQAALLLNTVAVTVVIVIAMIAGLVWHLFKGIVSNGAKYTAIKVPLRFFQDGGYWSDKSHLHRNYCAMYSSMFKAYHHEGRLWGWVVEVGVDVALLVIVIIQRKSAFAEENCKALCVTVVCVWGLVTIGIVCTRPHHCSLEFLFDTSGKLVMCGISAISTVKVMACLNDGRCEDDVYTTLVNLCLWGFAILSLVNVTISCSKIFLRMKDHSTPEVGENGSDVDLKENEKELLMMAALQDEKSSSDVPSARSSVSTDLL